MGFLGGYAEIRCMDRTTPIFKQIKQWPARVLRTALNTPPRTLFLHECGFAPDVEEQFLQDVRAELARRDVHECDNGVDN